jgi:hypothetical protein
MSNSIVASQGLATVTLTAGQSIALNSLTETTVFEQVGFPNYPTQNDLEATFTGYDGPRARMPLARRWWSKPVQPKWPIRSASPPWSLA